MAAGRRRDAELGAVAVVRDRIVAHRPLRIQHHAGCPDVDGASHRIGRPTAVRLRIPPRERMACLHKVPGIAQYRGVGVVVIFAANRHGSSRTAVPVVSHTELHFHDRSLVAVCAVLKEHIGDPRVHIQHQVIDQSCRESGAPNGLPSASVELHDCRFFVIITIPECDIRDAVIDLHRKILGRTR